MIDVGTVLTALSGLVIAIGTVLTQRSRRVQLDVRQFKRDLRRRTEQFQIALRHIGRLEDHWSSVGRKPPKRPSELDPDWGLDDDDDPGPDDKPKGLKAL